jgi:hypothetical protein
LLDQNVQTAVSADSLRDRRPPLRVIGNVQSYPERTAPFRADLGRQANSLISIEIRHDDKRTIRRQAPADRRANSTGAARHQRRPAVKRSHAPPLFAVDDVAERLEALPAEFDKL